MNTFDSNVAKQDAGFNLFVDDVSPRDARGAQPVFFAELYLVLQVLWQIYQFLDKMGFFKKFFTVLRVKRAMKKGTPAAKQEALEVLRDGLVVPV